MIHKYKKTSDSNKMCKKDFGVFVYTKKRAKDFLNNGLSQEINSGKQLGRCCSRLVDCCLCLGHHCSRESRLIFKETVKIVF